MNEKEKDLIQRAQDIQRYTENRCKTLEERIAELEKENAELKIDIEIADSQRQLAEKENEELKAKYESYLRSHTITCGMTEEEIIEMRKENKQLKAYESHWEEIEEDAKVIAKENAELKEQIEIQYAENQTLGNNNFELLKKLGTYNEQVEKMKNFYNCAHSNRALCPNEHNCKGCKDWELVE